MNVKSIVDRRICTGCSACNICEHIKFIKNKYGEYSPVIAWGLWTLNRNLKTTKYGHRFLDVYGRECIDKHRLRICGLLAAMERNTYTGECL